jgi:HAD superfamily hydrolase (TIGR01456 family)
METIQRLPAIVTDIDGVLIREKNAIPGSADGIRFLKTPLNEIDADRFSGMSECLPFVCLTNSGLGTEKEKAETVSKKLALKDHEKIDSEEMIVNFTPLRKVIQEYKDKLVMLVGEKNLDGLADNLNLKRYITDEEFCTLFPVLVPFREQPLQENVEEDMRKKIALRLGIVDQKEFEEPFQIHAIFILSDPIKWDQRIQIICDLLSTSDGKIAKKMPARGPENHIPVYCGADDLTFAGTFSLPRIGFGCFNKMLKETYKLVYKRDLELLMCGKPSKVTFDYTENYVKQQTKMEISNFYMIGDNPKTDIRGGNAAGWITILVKTGIFHQTEEFSNDPDDPAKYVVEDFAEALKLICKLEGIKCSLI